MVHSHTRWDGKGWNGMGCAGKSVYLNEGVHTLSYQRSPYHTISSHRVCQCTIIRVLVILIVFSQRKMYDG